MNAHEYGAALIAIGTIMQRLRISAAAVMSNAHDAMRIDIMAEHGVDRARAKELLEVDISQLVGE